MRTIHSSSHLSRWGKDVCCRGVCQLPGGCLLRGVCSWGVCSQGGVCSGGVCSWGVSTPWGGYLRRGEGCLLLSGPGGSVSQHALRETPPCGQTHACENITFATSLRTVNRKSTGVVNTSGKKSRCLFSTIGVVPVLRMNICWTQ